MVAITNSKYPFFVTAYFSLMDKEPHRFCKDQWALRKLVEYAFKSEDIYADEELASNYFGLAKYMTFKETFEWEDFVLGLHLCTFWKASGMPRWPDLCCLIGRGAGKDGVIALESLALISPYNQIEEYDVDICANNEKQAKRPVNDLYKALERNSNKLKKFFYWTKEKIEGKKRKSTIEGHTNNAKGKDGLRSGCVVFNEYHGYENYENIDVFTTGLGKTDHPRRSIFTTNGNVIDGPLDELIKEGEEVLFNGAPDNGMLYYFCRLDSKDEVDDEENWHKPNPSLRYRPSLHNEIRKEYHEWKKNPARLPAFMTKRMNIRELNNELKVTSWDNILATNKEIPDLKGLDCTIGIDFSKTNDWAGINAHFKVGENRYDINHAWICMQSDTLSRLKCPYKDWANKGDLTLVFEPEINPQLLIDFILQIAKKYRIKMVGLDSFRYALMCDYLSKIGFSHENKNIKLIRPSDIMKTIPVIDRCFTNQYFHWGDVPHLRWSTNNTKLVRAKRSTLAEDGEVDVGNYLYGKIEPKARKTDPFLALVASMCCESSIVDVQRSTNRKRVRVKTYG
ncbi:MAG: terminase TerL endonuclease subunit [Anaerorhabdus sp.]|uniref:terminase TerL endonuclease subunit n=1 Tax=Anaerorhabdus sp. TaxID=1872524 RepID=UPI003A83918F